MTFTLTQYHTIPHFDALKIGYIAVENIVRKGEIACNNVYYQIWYLFSISNAL